LTTLTGSRIIALARCNAVAGTVWQITDEDAGPTKESKAPTRKPHNARPVVSIRSRSTSRATASWTVPAQTRPTAITSERETRSA
jgi:hypothetical protein